MIAAFAAYAFTFMQFPGRDTLFVIVVALLVVPNQVALVPLLRLYTDVGLTGQYAAVYSHPGRLVDRRLPARQPSGSGRLAADRDGHVARHPGPGPKPPIGHRAVHRALLPARRLRRPAPRAHRPRHAGRGRQRRAAAPLDVDELAALWEGRPLQLKDIEAIADHLPGARLRYADFFAALAGAFDRGHWSNEDVDLAILTVPTLLSRAEADAAMRVVLEDYGHYATGRKPRQGEDALLVLAEFSALASGVDSAINLAERVRDAGAQVVAAQSVEGLGDHRQAHAAAGQLRGRDRGPPVSRPGAAARPGRPGSGVGAQLGAGLLRAPRAGQGPHGGPAPHRPRAGPPSPARRGVGDPSRPVHPPACPATARRVP
jgi:hypothetical protein